MIGRNVILIPARSTGAHPMRQERQSIFARIVTATLLERWRTQLAYHACFSGGGLDLWARADAEAAKDDRYSGRSSLSVAFLGSLPKSDAGKRTTDYIATAVDTRSKISYRDVL